MERIALRCQNIIKFPSLVYDSNYIWRTQNYLKDVAIKDGINFEFMDDINFSLKCPKYDYCLSCFYYKFSYNVNQRMSEYDEPCRIAIKRVSFLLLRIGHFFSYIQEFIIITKTKKKNSY